MPTHAPTFDQHVGDREALADFGTGLGRGVDQQLVENDPAWAVRDRVRRWSTDRSRRSRCGSAGNLLP
jgi:hypothetical protein